MKNKYKNNQDGISLIKLLLTLVSVIIVGIMFVYAYQIYEEAINKGEIAGLNIVLTDKANENVTNVITKINEAVQNQVDVLNVIPLEENRNTSQQAKNEAYNTSKQTTNNKFFYNQLNENAQEIYNAIEENLENMKSGDYKIKLSDNIAEVLYETNGEEVLDKNFQSAWDALIFDRPDVFYLDISQVSLMINKTTRGSNVKYALYLQPSTDTYLEESFTSKEEVESAVNQVNTIKQAIISNLPSDDYSKILIVHDWLVENISYNLQESSANDYNIYGALVNKTAVCEGYAESLKFILDEIGIPCILVCGTATNSEGTTEQHEWNYVQLNGKWYAIDVTWDDPVATNGAYVSVSTKHKYFLKGANTMNENHFVSGQISEAGQQFALPELEQEDYN